MSKWDDFAKRRAAKGKEREKRAKERREAKGIPAKKKKKTKAGWWDDQLGFDGSDQLGTPTHVTKPVLP